MTDAVTLRQIEARNAAMHARYDEAPDKTLVIDPAHYLEQVLRERAAGYAAHVAGMEIGVDMFGWAMGMAIQYKNSNVQCTYFIADWITALLILRYGEEHRAYDAAEVAAAIAEGRAPNCSTDPNFAGWPVRFSPADKLKALDILRGMIWPAPQWTLLSPERES
jgi:hypothetical protein